MLPYTSRLYGLYLMLPFLDTTNSDSKGCLYFSETDVVLKIAIPATRSLLLVLYLLFQTDVKFTYLNRGVDSVNIDHCQFHAHPYQVPYLICPDTLIQEVTTILSGHTRLIMTILFLFHLVSIATSRSYGYELLCSID